MLCAKIRTNRLGGLITIDFLTLCVAMHQFLIRAANIHCHYTLAAKPDRVVLTFQCRFVCSFYTSRSQAECMNQCQFLPRIKMPVEMASTALSLSPLLFSQCCSFELLSPFVCLVYHEILVYSVLVWLWLSVYVGVCLVNSCLYLFILRFSIRCIFVC